MTNTGIIILIIIILIMICICRGYIGYKLADKFLPQKQDSQNEQSSSISSKPLYILFDR